MAVHLEFTDIGLKREKDRIEQHFSKMHQRRNWNIFTLAIWVDNQYFVETLVTIGILFKF